MAFNGTELEAFDLTHVLYDPKSKLSHALALATLSPILLMACYGALTVVTREAVILNMWAGQLACEGFNYVLKNWFKEERPIGKHGTGYGFPSSHSQFMGYFSSFLIMHLWFRHRFVLKAPVLLRGFGYLIILGFAGVVCFSRYYLSYHTAPQIIWGYIIGAALGSTYYTLTELIPFKYPTNSILGRLRNWFIGSPVMTWLRVKDGWAVWDDGGHEDAYLRWRGMWEAKMAAKSEGQPKPSSKGNSEKRRLNGRNKS